MHRAIIDCGHGGNLQQGESSPFGTIGPTGLREKDVVLELGARLAKQLGGALTRHDDTNLSLGERIDRARAGGASEFLSLHLNRGRPADRGPELWVHSRAGQSSWRLARALETELSRFGSPSRRVSAAELAVLTPERHAPGTAACLVEVDYLSHQDVERRMRDPRHLDELAGALARGVARFRGVADALEDRPLAWGQVLFVEVRTDSQERLTHEYPIDVNGNIKFPTLGLVAANGLTTDQLADSLRSLLLGSVLRNPTVNVTLTRKIVAYGALVTQSRLHVRVLSAAGDRENLSGDYPVRIDGTIVLPGLSPIAARDRRLDEVEADVQAAYEGAFIRNGVVHVTTQHLA